MGKSSIKCAKCAKKIRSQHSIVQADHMRCPGCGQNFCTDHADWRFGHECSGMHALMEHQRGGLCRQEMERKKSGAAGKRQAMLGDAC